MIIHPRNSYKTLADYLPVVLKAYPEVETAIDHMIDPARPEYLIFHRLSLQDHVPVIWIRQKGKIFQVNRSSNIRGTPGYERYVKHLYHEDPLESDERNVAYRYHIDKWDPWVTIPL